MEEAFLLGTGREVGVYFEEGGLVSVEACLLPGTDKACFEDAVSDLFVGEPSGKDSISSVTRGPCLVTLLLAEKP